MADLTKYIPTELACARRVHAALEADAKCRTHLGLSACGHKCPRFLWYQHQGRGPEAVKPDGRTLDLFGLGNVIEDVVIASLRKAGYTVEGEQAEVVFQFESITLRGHIDGIITGLEESKKPHLLEVKSSNAKRFKELQKLASYQDWDEKYKFQVQAYMLGLALDRCLVVVYCKDNSERYYERIRLDKSWIVPRMETVFRNISLPCEPERACPNADFFEAKWCGFREICFEDPAIAKHRRAASEAAKVLAGALAAGVDVAEILKKHGVTHA